MIPEREHEIKENMRQTKLKKTKFGVWPVWSQVIKCQSSYFLKHTGELTVKISQLVRTYMYKCDNKLHQKISCSKSDSCAYHKLNEPGFAQKTAQQNPA